MSRQKIAADIHGLIIGHGVTEVTLTLTAQDAWQLAEDLRHCDYDRRAPEIRATVRGAIQNAG